MKKIKILKKIILNIFKGSSESDEDKKSIDNKRKNRDKAKKKKTRE